MLEVDVCTPIVCMYFLRIIKLADYTTPSWYLHMSSNAPTAPSVHPRLGNLSFVIGLPRGAKTCPSNAWSPGAFKKHLKGTQLREISEQGDFTF